MKNTNTITPLAGIPAYKSATDGLGRLGARRAELLGEQHSLEKKLREPVAETTGFLARTTALLKGEPVREDHEALRARHLEVRHAVESIGETTRLGRLELQSIEAEARAAAVKAIEPTHRVLRQQAAELLEQLLQVATAEQALLAEAGTAGYVDLVLPVRVLPWQLADALDPDSLVQRHLRELRAR